MAEHFRGIQSPITARIHSTISLNFHRLSKSQANRFLCVIIDMNVLQSNPILKNNSASQTKQNTWLISLCSVTREGGSEQRGLRSCNQLYANNEWRVVPVGLPAHISPPESVSLSEDYLGTDLAIRSSCAAKAQLQVPSKPWISSSREREGLSYLHLEGEEQGRACT